ncbi:actin regulatory protein [Pholiota molesta]|nr:actin regulatory protein [Pholiota molesta]
MAHLTKPTVYNIEDSNISLLGSDLEKRVREASGEGEEAWNDAGKAIGLQIWRIEKFHVVPWPKERYGSFYDGDSYIILRTYKKTPQAESFSYDLHFWLGQSTTQDEAGTAAYKTVELDDFLHGKPVQSRECQGYESPRFLSYFPRFVCLQGGVATGFHHVSDPIPYTFASSTAGQSHLVVREVPATAKSLVVGDVYVLDKGAEILQLNTKSSTGQERFKAAEFVQSSSYSNDVSKPRSILWRMSDATGALSSDDAFLIDCSADMVHPAIFVWIGRQASLNEKRLSLHYAQCYLYDRTTKISPTTRFHVAIPIVKIQEGEETTEFLDAI